MAKQPSNLLNFSTAIFLTALLLLGCSHSDEKALDRQVFRYNEHKNISSLDPAFAKDNANIWAVHQAMFSTKIEPTYSKIDGGWMTPDQTQYGVIHRMAVSKNYRRKGIAKYIFNTCETMLKTSQIKSMRIDTHEQNHGMRTLLKTLNYNYCGVIYLENGDKRLAYEKLIQ